MAAKKTSDARVALEQVFDSIPNLDAKWRKLIEEAFAAEKTRDVSVGITCKCCGKYRRYVVQVPLPDWSARTKALDLLLTQAKGKPAETKTVDLKVFAAQTRAELEGMSDEELALLAAVEQSALEPKPTKELTSGHQEKEASGVQGSGGRGRRSAREEGRARGAGEEARGRDHRGKRA